MDDLLDRRSAAQRLRTALLRADDIDRAVLEHQLLPAIEGAGDYLDDVELSRRLGRSHTTCMRRRVTIVAALFPNADLEAVRCLRETRR